MNELEKVEHNILCNLQLRAEMRELYLQRDRAQARLDEVLKKIEEEEAAKALVFLIVTSVLLQASSV